jgi:hypothetical protein
VSNNRERFFLIGILIVGILVRILAMFFAPCQPSESGDEGMYYRLAVEVLEKGPLAPERTPLYPWFVALCLMAFRSPISVLWAQAIITASWPLIVWATGKKLGMRPTLALWAGLAVAVFPPFILYPTRAWLTESLFTTLLFLALWGLAAGARFWPGLVWGISALARPISPIMALGYPIARMTRPRQWLPFILGLVIVACPFFVFNALTGKDRTPYGTHGGAGILDIIRFENGPCAEGTQVYAGLLEAPEGTDCSDILWRLKRPHTIPVLMLKKAGYLTLPYRGVKMREMALGPWPARLLVILLVVIPDVVAFLLGGFYLSFIGIRRRDVFPLSWLWLSTLGLALIFHGETRYLFPVFPAFIIGAFLLWQERKQIRWWMILLWLSFCALLIFAWISWCVPFYLHHPLR